MAKYRVKVIRGNNLPYIPQVWRWWFPFWRPLSVSCGEGGSWWHTAYDTPAKAWDEIDKDKRIENLEYQYVRPLRDLEK